MADTTAIREGMDVVGSDGGEVGTVSRVEGDRITLSGDDVVAKGTPHYLSADFVAAVDTRVHLSQPARQIRNA